MEFNDYQSFAQATTVYPSESKLIYPALKLNGEAGEVAEKVGKWLRGDYELTEEVKNAIANELGDVLWYLTALATDLDMSLENIVQMNISKLASRRSRGMIRGDGDNR